MRETAHERPIERTSIAAAIDCDKAKIRENALYVSQDPLTGDLFCSLYIFNVESLSLIDFDEDVLANLIQQRTFMKNLRKEMVANEREVYSTLHISYCIRYGGESILCEMNEMETSFIPIIDTHFHEVSSDVLPENFVQLMQDAAIKAALILEKPYSLPLGGAQIVELLTLLGTKLWKHFCTQHNIPVIEECLGNVSHTPISSPLRNISALANVCQMIHLIRTGEFLFDHVEKDLLTQHIHTKVIERHKRRKRL